MCGAFAPLNFLFFSPRGPARFKKSEVVGVFAFNWDSDAVQVKICVCECGEILSCCCRDNHYVALFVFRFVSEFVAFFRFNSGQSVSRSEIDS